MSALTLRTRIEQELAREFADAMARVAQRVGTSIVYVKSVWEDQQVRSQEVDSPTAHNNDGGGR